MHDKSVLWCLGEVAMMLNWNSIERCPLSSVLFVFLATILNIQKDHRSFDNIVLDMHPLLKVRIFTTRKNQGNHYNHYSTVFLYMMESGMNEMNPSKAPTTTTTVYKFTLFCIHFVQCNPRHDEQRSLYLIVDPPHPIIVLHDWTSRLFDAKWSASTSDEDK